ncbi:MAG: MFS transporter [Alphaproteobacteria bacterium]|jgi:nitrate/nitrite transporter NarK|nr:MFS transporter [Alphaproteobacteria bacterium]MDP6623057.1 MFS transporter [Alphaproteobacteria bacterium]MDP6814597.1 MFS transporter [Alphaproteobacteria bacterium]
MDLTRFSPRTILAVATVSMLVQQAFAYVCQIVMPILADRLAEDFGISPAWLGLYLFLQNVMAIIAALGCGSFILRYGPLRISQLTLLLMGGNLLVIASGQLWLYPLGAILLGAAAVSTPASSHILSRVCPPRLVPVIFSVKQTGVPVGALIGGLLIPFLLGLVFYSATLGTTIRLGPYGAALVTALIVFLVALSLQPIRTHFDDDRDPGQKISFGDIRTTLVMVLRNPSLRDIAFAAFAFGGLQALFSGFFILYLIDGLGYSEIEAGSAFAIASFTAIWARILWGALGGGFVPSRWILAGIGLFSGIAALLMTQFDFTWTLNEIIAVAILFNITALSWHGILLAETARLAPEGQVGGVTGGVLSFTSIAMMIYPALYGLILAATGSYEIGFAIAAIPAFAAFVIFLNPSFPASWFGFCLGLARRLRSLRALARMAALLALGVTFGLVFQALGF